MNMYIMANMGFPVITRLGTNQFWYNHWYNDFSYARYFHNVKSANDFVSLYFKYGVSFSTNIFCDKYWFTKKFSKLKSEKALRLYHLCFRKKLFENKTFNVREVTDSRLNTGEFFPMRLWTFRFGHWIIFLIHWFKPVKSKLNRKNTKRFDNFRRHATSYRKINVRSNFKIMKIIKNINNNYKYSF